MQRALLGLGDVEQQLGPARQIERFLELSGRVFVLRLLVVAAPSLEVGTRALVVGLGVDRRDLRHDHCQP